MGTGTGGASARAAGLTSAGSGNTNSRQSRGGNMARRGAGKASSFFKATTVTGDVRSFSFAVLMVVHMVHGCSPSNVFFTPESKEPSSCEYVHNIPAQATVCNAPQCPPATKNMAAAATRWPTNRRRRRENTTDNLPECGRRVNSTPPTARLFRPRSGRDAAILCRKRKAGAGRTPRLARTASTDDGKR